ncbi:hypothetical protein [Streptobacillus moniliformis]|uniref:hypothetical protein n=1 Tax=Streptobacillus moniliformis TaxID=34105 RepID=UPI0007E45B4C|nr:hypothetical protein [Streptobacillus moniliformis]
MKKLNLFDFDNVSDDLKKIEKERREILTVLNVTKKILVVLKAIVIIVYALTFINENLTEFFIEIMKEFKNNKLKERI